MFARYVGRFLALTLYFTAGLNHAFVVQEQGDNNTAKGSEPFEKVVSFDFESGVVGRRPRGWKRMGSSSFSAAMSKETPRSGNRCLRLSSEGQSSVSEMTGALEFKVEPAKCLGNRIRFRASMRSTSENGSLLMSLSSRFRSGEIGAVELLRAKRLDLGEWSDYEIVLDISEESQTIKLSFLIQGTGDFFVDDVSLEIVDETVAKSVQSAASLAKNIQSEPGLFEVKGAFEVFTDQNDADQVRVLIPLPLLHRKQFPLTYHLSANPPESFKSVRIYEDKPKNFVAELTLHQLAKRKRIQVKFDSLILVLPDTFEDVPQAVAIPDEWPSEVKSWLRPTWCVGSVDTRIQGIAKEIRAETDDVFEVIQKVEARAQAIYDSATGRVTDHTAVQMLDKKGTCIGCANLIAGLLRAADVPARILAGYPSWSGPLETHFIVEAYVPGTGWYPIESRLCRSPWPNKNQINVAIVDPQYETKEMAGYRPGGSDGVPYLTVTEIPDNDGRYTFWGALEEREGCSHLCQFIRKLEAGDSDWLVAADWASKRWKSWLTTEPPLANGQVRFGPQTSEIKSNVLSQLISEFKN